MSSPGSSEAGKPIMWKTHFNKEGATSALISIVGSENIQSLLLDKTTMKKAVWAQVADEMKEMGYDLGLDGGTACHQKWRNLKRAYVMHITKPSSRSPPYIKELQKALEMTKKLLNTTKPIDSCLDDLPDLEGSDTESTFPTFRNYPTQSVHLAEVLAMVVKADKDRRKREAEMEKRCEERFSRLETLLNHQNEQLEKFNHLLLEVTKSNMEAKKRKLNDDSEEN